MKATLLLTLGLVRRLAGIRVKHAAPFRAAVENKSGLEIGGPSAVFRDMEILPLYRHVASLDNCVFSAATVWEGTRAEGLTFCYRKGKPPGFNFIREGTALGGIDDHSYDFTLSSHCLEHVANPIQALKEWQRVVTPGGSIIVLLPDYRHTFDHRRKPTSVSHMVEDYNRGVDETDTTHLEEILTLHDVSRDPGAGTPEQFRERSLRNFENRCLHHHVFDEHNSPELLEAAGLKVAHLELVGPHHIVILAHS